MNKKVLHIVGPTGVGKTDLAFKLAARFNGELVSADSVQVYKGLDIISGKDIPQNSPFTHLDKFSNKDFNVGYYTVRNTPIYLLDVVELTFPFSVSQFEKLGDDMIRLILNKKRLPIVVGGTGLYVQSLLKNIETATVAPDLDLRKQLESLGLEELQEKLKKLNKEKFSSMNNSDVNNKRRLIRAIEVSGIKNCELSIKEERKDALLKYKHIQIGLCAPREFLKQRIDRRVDSRLENGAMEEAEKLFKNYSSLTQQVKDANGYKQLFEYLQNKISFEEAIYRWKISEYRHAKNQMTWFKKYGNVVWFDITKKGFEKKINASLKRHLT